MAYESRTYRRTVCPTDLTRFEVRIGETDLCVCAASDPTDAAEDLVVQARWEIDEFIRGHPYLSETPTPLDVPETAPRIVKRMAEAAKAARVGPMTVVDGAITEHVARGLTEHFPEVIVESDGDVYLVGATSRTIALWVGEEGAPGVGLVVAGGLMPVAVCTSSRTDGRSATVGRTDAVTVIARNGALAHAVATALADQVRDAEDVERAIEAARNVFGILGVLVIAGDRIDAWGHVRLVSLD